MGEKKVTKISMSTFFLILALIAIIVMGIFIYKLNNDKTTEIKKSTQLQTQVANLNETVSDLQEKINNISNTINNKNTDDNTSNNSEKLTLSSINKRLYQLYSNQRYVLLMDDNTYDTNQDFLKKKTYILDLNMVNGNDIVREIDLSRKLTPFVNTYINKNKGSLDGDCTVEYFGVEDMTTPPLIDEENEVAFKVYYRCVDGNIETSLGYEIYAYNIQTDTIRVLGKAN